ncbi:MAG: PEP/pyruvate-binding domain-containing protein [Patescibacteria group bacterium]|nr:PEP/pyruvate-binding domain-containing protein [Patescibacteria group bacterium]
MEKVTLPFSQIGRESVKEAGGKGANLGELTKAGIPVPPGFVVLASTFQKYLEISDLDVELDSILDELKIKDISSVERESRKMRSLIDKAKVPAEIQKGIQAAFKRLGAKFVAVRSSATAEDSKVASWAGELDTLLFVTQPELINAVRKCWSSLYTPRALFYRFEKKLHHKMIRVAVVVQKMVNSMVSGIAFTTHPVTRDPNQMIIEAGWGLGEAIVSGQITPDAYVIDKEDNSFIDINVNKQEMMIVQARPKGTKKAIVPRAKQAKQKLTNSQIQTLVGILRRIEKYYGSPQDIEWAYDGKFYIVQTRPITTL